MARHQLIANNYSKMLKITYPVLEALGARLVDSGGGGESTSGPF